MQQRESFGRRGNLSLFALSAIGLLSTAYLFALGYALWREGARFEGPHWFLIGLVLVLDLCCIGLWQIRKRNAKNDVTQPPQNDGGDIRALFIIAFIAGAIVLLIAAVVGAVIWAVWSVQRDARRFCDETPIGSPISKATARASDKKIVWGASGKYYHNAPIGEGSPYTFHFIATFMDKAVCELSIDREGKVTSKHFEIESD